MRSEFLFTLKRMSILKEIKLIVESVKPITLQTFLIDQKGVSKRLLTKLKRREGGIMRNGQAVRSIDTVYNGDEIILSLADESFLEPNGSLNVPVAFENESLIIFDRIRPDYALSLRILLRRSFFRDAAKRYTMRQFTEILTNPERLMLR